ncbi:MAG: GSCFA domain-containing protein [Duncaniella sp.]|nr:GSCFA domain-containing protein [Duncaniella sp.]
MKFRTDTAPITHTGIHITHSDSVVMIGSCFTDNIGSLMRADLLDVTVNPFGPLYNPASIAAAVRRLAEGHEIKEIELVEREGRFHSWDFHSRYSGERPAEALDNMNASIMKAHEALQKATTVILTLGTTHVYRHRDADRVVANCHKFPAGEFEERNLTLNECTGLLLETIDTLRSMNKDVRVLFTVSPLRYTAYGMHANTLMKATLHIAIEAVMAQREGTEYFPAFEIMMDDLRDYRFYAPDMKHPTQQAVEYIYEIFSQSYYDSATQALAEKARALTRRLAHRSLSGAETPTDSIIADFLKQYPQLSHTIACYK